MTNCGRRWALTSSACSPASSLFGTEQKDWKPFTMPDGTPCLVPGAFNLTPAPDGGWLMYPQGDTTVPPSGHMPAGGYFFDSIVRQPPIQEEKLDPEDNLGGIWPPVRARPRLLSRPEDLVGTARAERGGAGHSRHGVRRYCARARPVSQTSPRHSRHRRVVHLHQNPPGLRAGGCSRSSASTALENLNTLMELFGDAPQMAS